MAVKGQTVKFSRDIGDEPETSPLQLGNLHIGAFHHPAGRHVHLGFHVPGAGHFSQVLVVDAGLFHLDGSLRERQYGDKKGKSFEE